MISHFNVPSTLVSVNAARFFIHFEYENNFIFSSLYNTPGMLATEFKIINR